MLLLLAVVALLFVAGLAGVPGSVGQAHAAAPVVTDFESFALGDLNGQDGWTSGHGSSTCPVYDVEVVPNTLAPTSFASKSLRISNAITCSSFNDQTFSPSLANEAGETSADTSTYSGGTRQPYFQAQWDFASTVPGSEQPGLSVVASADRGDPGRMSWLQMADTPAGLQLNFEDYQHSISNFVLTPIATGLDRAVAHTVRVTAEFVDGSANDVVRVYLDGALIHTGTTWEDYYRDFAGPVPHAVDSIMFREAGTAAPATLGHGLLIDNFSSYSGPVPNADLTSLSLGGTLSPAFDPATTAYTAAVGNAVTNAGISATAHPGAAIVVTGDSNLAVGNNTVTITVTDGDGTTTKSYTVTVDRAAPPTPASPAPTPSPPVVPPAPVVPTPPTAPPPVQSGTPLIVRVSAARRAPLALRHAFTPRVLTSIAAQATVSLTGNRQIGKIYANWTRTLGAGASYPTLKIPAHLRIALPGVYRLTFKVRAGDQSVLYSVPMRLSSRSLSIALPVREADVLLVATPSISETLTQQLSARYLVKTVDTDTVFTAVSAPNERVGTVLLNASEAGLTTIHHLHRVFPDLHVIAIVQSAAAGRLAKAAGASTTVVEPASSVTLTRGLATALRATLRR